MFREQNFPCHVPHSCLLYTSIARILCRAAENGKEVVALMELRARFDEANNIAWSKMLEEAGCRCV